MTSDVGRLRQAVEEAIASATDVHSAFVGVDGDVVTLEVCEHGVAVAQRLKGQFGSRLRVSVTPPGHEWRRTPR